MRARARNYIGCVEHNRFARTTVVSGVMGDLVVGMLFGTQGFGSIRRMCTSGLDARGIRV